MNLEDAIQAHVGWKLKFRSAIGTKARMDADTIGRDNCCPVGIWLHGDGKATLGKQPEYIRALDAHRAFHVQAGKVAGLVNAAKYAEAEAAMGAGTPYATVSAEVGSAFIALKKLVPA